VIADSNDGIVYMDPDIVCEAPWSFYESWLCCGVALCEDVNSPVSPNHPRRIAWRNYYGSYGIVLHSKSHSYVNGGFTGVLKSDYAFLTCGKKYRG
jgi:hypothetical protein